MTQKEKARKGIITKEMEIVAVSEGRTPEEIRAGVEKGTIVIPANPLHRGLKPIGIGTNLRTKVNANIGTSPECSNIDKELKKLEVCIEAKADTVMDLSTSGDLDKIRRLIIESSPMPVGTVPIYQAVVEASSVENMTEDLLFDVIERHAKDGVDFMTVHCGVTFETIGRLKKHPRIMDVVSRGGAFLVAWILKNKKENPLYTEFDRLLDIAKKYDVTLSLGDGMRPGSIIDAGDPPQIQELIILGDLTSRASKAHVQVIIEGPGHVPFDKIKANVDMAKDVCKGAPLYVLGPLPTDIAPGYDHITSAIGGTLAAAAGADFLCYVTRSEHLSLPEIEDVKEGIIASRIAAHAADIVKSIPHAKDWDLEISKARKSLDWEKQVKLSVDPQRSKELLRGTLNGPCTMCGEFCAMAIMNETLKTG